MSYATEARFDGFEMFIPDNHGLHWQWGIVRELNLLLLQLLIV